jgi:hypothetical protein
MVFSMIVDWWSRALGRIANVRQSGVGGRRFISLDIWSAGVVVLGLCSFWSDGPITSAGWPMPIRLPRCLSQVSLCR